MKGGFLIGSNEPFIESNVYANRSALVLDWLLKVGLDKDGFSIREVAKDRGISVGLVQKVFEVLVYYGLLRFEGVRTAKRFFFKKPGSLLKSWLEEYSIVKKCKMWTYRSAFKKEELIGILRKSKFAKKVALALHSAAESHGFKNTNLNTLELYLLDSAAKSELEKILRLEPQEKGYEVLLIEPYYKSLLDFNMDSFKNLKISPILLTFLDLYHYPLRGLEQAELMAERAPELKRIYKKG